VIFEQLASGLGFTEGPVLLQDGGVVVTSIDTGAVYFVDRDGATSAVDVGGGPNGATEGPDGSIYIAQNGGYRYIERHPGWTGGVQAIRPDRTVDWITQDPISPNDLCFGPDGLLYLTDPTRPRSRSDGRLWRVDVDAKEAELLTSTSWYPNGIAFGSEDDAVYVADTGGQSIVRMALTPTGLGKPEVAVQMQRGFPDGFAFDRDGNFVIAANSFDDAPGSVQTWDREGTLLDTIEPGPARFYTNLAIGEDGTVIVTDSENGAILIGEDAWPTPGMPLHPWR
jgi:gluconolactonase